MNVTITKTVLLEHSASFVQPFSGGSLFAAAGDFKYISLFDLSGDETETVARLLPCEFGPIYAVAAHPSEPRLALIENDALVVIDRDGTRFFEETERNDPGRLGEERGFLACVFDPNGPYLWCVVRHSPEVVEIQVRDPDLGTLIQSHQQEDPYWESHCSLYVNMPGAGVTLWLAGGQEGQQVYWLRQSPEGIVCVAEPVLEDTAPPVFSPSGDEFLVWRDDALHRYGYPSREPLGTFPCPWEDAEWSHDFCYLDAARILAASSEQRLFVLDLNRWKESLLFVPIDAL
jgi:hypothetical protein